jgi:serine/threonine protein kinase
MPPEMIKGDVHSFSADVWSFAICILELANNEAPNRDNRIKAMYTVATVGLPNPLAKPERWSHNFKWFISACLNTNPVERASAVDLLTHPFFKDVASRSVMTEIFSSIFITKALNTFL